jgi:hypothetical protein
MDEPTCGNCRFWKRHKHYIMSLGIETQEVDAEWGDCRQSPPTRYGIAVSDPDDFRAAKSASGFPTTLQGDWCGQHEPKEPK